MSLAIRRVGLSDKALDGGTSASGGCQATGSWYSSAESWNNCKEISQRSRSESRDQRQATAAAAAAVAVALLNFMLLRTVARTVRGRCLKEERKLFLNDQLDDWCVTWASRVPLLTWTVGSHWLDSNCGLSKASGLWSVNDKRGKSGKGRFVRRWWWSNLAVCVAVHSFSNLFIIHLFLWLLDKLHLGEKSREIRQQSASVLRSL